MLPQRQDNIHHVTFASSIWLGRGVNGSCFDATTEIRVSTISSCLTTRQRVGIARMSWPTALGIISIILLNIIIVSIVCYSPDRPVDPMLGGPQKHNRGRG